MTMDTSKATRNDLEQALDHILKAPKQEGRIEWIARRPDIGKREVLQQAELDETVGLKGDNWYARANGAIPPGSAYGNMQITLMNARVIAAIAGDKKHWALAGDQFYVDLDLSQDNLPPGSRLMLENAIVEVTAEPHLGCRKFSDRFGKDAVAFVNSNDGKALNLRGVNARVVQGGIVRVGDTVSSISR